MNICYYELITDNVTFLINTKHIYLLKSPLKRLCPKGKKQNALQTSLCVLYVDMHMFVIVF